MARHVPRTHQFVNSFLDRNFRDTSIHAAQRAKDREALRAAAEARKAQRARRRAELARREAERLRAAIEERSRRRFVAEHRRKDAHSRALAEQAAQVIQGSVRARQRRQRLAASRRAEAEAAARAAAARRLQGWWLRVLSFRRQKERLAQERRDAEAAAMAAQLEALDAQMEAIAADSDTTASAAAAAGDGSTVRYSPALGGGETRGGAASTAEGADRSDEQAKAGAGRDIDQKGEGDGSSDEDYGSDEFDDDSSADAVEDENEATAAESSRDLGGGDKESEARPTEDSAPARADVEDGDARAEKPDAAAAHGDTGGQRDAKAKPEARSPRMKPLPPALAERLERLSRPRSVPKPEDDYPYVPHVSPRVPSAVVSPRGPAQRALSDAVEWAARRRARQRRSHEVRAARFLADVSGGPYVPSGGRWFSDRVIFDPKEVASSPATHGGAATAGTMESALGISASVGEQPSRNSRVSSPREESRPMDIDDGRTGGYGSEDPYSEALREGGAEPSQSAQSRNSITNRGEPGATGRSNSGLRERSTQTPVSESLLAINTRDTNELVLAPTRPQAKSSRSTRRYSSEIASMNYQRPGGRHGQVEKRASSASFAPEGVATSESLMYEGNPSGQRPVPQFSGPTAGTQSHEYLERPLEPLDGSLAGASLDEQRGHTGEAHGEAAEAHGVEHGSTTAGERFAQSPSTLSREEAKHVEVSGRIVVGAGAETAEQLEEAGRSEVPRDAKSTATRTASPAESREIEVGLPPGYPGENRRASVERAGHVAKSPSKVSVALSAASVPGWVCSTCEFGNDAGAESCALCDEPRVG